MEFIEKNHDHYLDNPLNSFKLLKRNVIDLKFYLNFFPDIRQHFGSTEFPTEDDLSLAVTGLFRLQKSYKLKSEDLAKGNLNSAMTGSVLSTHDLFVIGKIALDTYENHFAEDYLELAMEKLILSTHEHDVSAFEITECLYELYLRKFDDKKANILLLNLDFKNRMKIKSKFRDAYEKARSFDAFQFRNPYDDSFVKNGYYDYDREMKFFSQVCRGQITKSPAETKDLSCYYHSTNYFTKIAPFKAEVANIDPQILILYNVTSESETETLKNILKQSELRPAQTVASNGTSIVTHNIRVAELGWFTENEHELFPILTERLEVSFPL